MDSIKCLRFHSIEMTGLLQIKQLKAARNSVTNGSLIKLLPRINQLLRGPFICLTSPEVPNIEKTIFSALDDVVVVLESSEFINK